MPEILEAAVEQMDKRLTNVEVMLRELSTKIDTNFRWTIGIMITMWVTVILTIIFNG